MGVGWEVGSGVPQAPICGERDQERTYSIPKAHILGRFPHPHPISPSLLPVENWSFLFSCLPAFLAVFFSFYKVQSRG